MTHNSRVSDLVFLGFDRRWFHRGAVLFLHKPFDLLSDALLSVLKGGWMFPSCKTSCITPSTFLISETERALI